MIHILKPSISSQLEVEPVKGLLALPGGSSGPMTGNSGDTRLNYLSPLALGPDCLYGCNFFSSRNKLAARSRDLAYLVAKGQE